MASELTGTNPVHGFVLGKARGATEFCGLEAALLAAVLIGLWCGINALVGIAGAALSAVGLNLLRRADNGRREHLELRLRSTTGKRRYRLVDADDAWKPLLSNHGDSMMGGRHDGR